MLPNGEITASAGGNSSSKLDRSAGAIDSGARCNRTVAEVAARHVSFRGPSGDARRAAISERQLKSCRRVRRMVAAPLRTLSFRSGIVRDGGTIPGYAVFAHVLYMAAAKLLCCGLGGLADHCRLARPGTA